MHQPGSSTSIINLRYQDGSEGSPSNPVHFKKQDCAQLKEYCLSRRSLFVDNTFPPDSCSLGDLPNLTIWQEDEVKWLRPADILRLQKNSDEPEFCLDGASRFDFAQGSLGNCWFLAALSSLTFHEQLLTQVVPMDQSFKNYAGIFHFRFWRFGKWVDVVIDDYLPTLNNQLLFAKSKCGNEFWVPLLEKAYAKVCGSYADMNAGLPSDACKDFSGGVTMIYNLGETNDQYPGDDEDLWLSLKRATECKSMICCGTASREGKLVNTIAHTGLVDAHAYTVTGVTEVELDGAKVKLVRIMNPWGAQEWNGNWSDDSDLWDRVSPADRANCLKHEDGEFWMALENFSCYFAMFSICCETPNFIDGDLSCAWKCMIYDGSWMAGVSAGGSINNQTFATNPQYRIQVTIIDKEDPEDHNILLSLMQKPQQKYRTKRRFYPTGLTIFKVPAGTPQGRLGRSFFNRNPPVSLQQIYRYERDLIELHSLEPGEYVIVPSTIKANMTADFVLCVYTKADAKISPYPTGGGDHLNENEKNNVIVPETPDKPKEEIANEDSTRDLFNLYVDQGGELNAIQLRKLLNDQFPHGTSHGFGLETCKSMIAIVDLNQRMTMTFTEFSILWKKINEYKSLFQQSDLNRCGRLSDHELQKAIEVAGLNVKDQLVRLMMFRYAGQTSTTLEEFIALMLRLDRMSGIFKDKSSEGFIHLSWEEWSNLSMYN
ncbi:calpain-1 catalytic subunit-like [Menidia menidia]